jgi:superfamily II DNA/RNA helicase
MSYQNSGRARFRARPQQRSSRGFGPQRANINRSRYINQAITIAEEVKYESTNTFDDFGLHPQIIQNIKERGYTNPTPIQDQGIPVLMQNKDIVGIANTGTGKTAAFLLPLVHKIANDNTQGALIMAPTRELALQILDELKLFAYQLNISVCLCIGSSNCATS